MKYYVENAGIAFESEMDAFLYVWTYKFANSAHLLALKPYQAYLAALEWIVKF